MENRTALPAGVTRLHPEDPTLRMSTSEVRGKPAALATYSQCSRLPESSVWEGHLRVTVEPSRAAQ